MIGSINNGLINNIVLNNIRGNSYSKEHKKRQNEPNIGGMEGVISFNLLQKDKRETGPSKKKTYPQGPGDVYKDGSKDVYSQKPLKHLKELKGQGMTKNNYSKDNGMAYEKASHLIALDKKNIKPIEFISKEPQGKTDKENLKLPKAVDASLSSSKYNTMNSTANNNNGSNMFKIGKIKQRNLYEKNERQSRKRDFAEDDFLHGVAITQDGYRKGGSGSRSTSKNKQQQK